MNENRPRFLRQIASGWYSGVVSHLGALLLSTMKKFVTKEVPQTVHLVLPGVSQGDRTETFITVEVVGMWNWCSAMLGQIPSASHSPTTLRVMKWLILGSVLIWHSYWPASRACTYLICKVHVSVDSTWNAWKRSSAMNVYRSTARMCASRRRIHETCEQSKRADSETHVS